MPIFRYNSYLSLLLGLDYNTSTCFGIVPLSLETPCGIYLIHVDWGPDIDLDRRHHAKPDTRSLFRWFPWILVLAAG